MQRSSLRPYSRYSRDAVAVLGQLVRSARTERKMTTLEVCQRAGISRGLLQRIERGQMTCEIGAVFEVAAIVGVPLFGGDAELGRIARHTDEKMALLPKSVRRKAVEVKDDF